MEKINIIGFIGCTAIFVIAIIIYLAIVTAKLRAMRRDIAQVIEESEREFIYNLRSFLIAATDILVADFEATMGDKKITGQILERWKMIRNGGLIGIAGQNNYFGFLNLFSNTLSLLPQIKKALGELRVFANENFGFNCRNIDRDTPIARYQLFMYAFSDIKIKWGEYLLSLKNEYAKNSKAD